MKISSFLTDRAEVKRMSGQVILTGSLLALYFWQISGPVSIAVSLWGVGVFAILISTWVIHVVPLRSPVNSLTINLAISFLFFLLGNLLQSKFTFEIIEQIGKAPSPDGLNGQAQVVTAAVVVFSGWEFFFIYIFNAFLGYIKFFQHTSEKQGVSSSSVSPDKFSIRQGGKIHLLSYSDVHCVEASGNYLNIFINDQKFLARMSLTEWLSGAPQKNFIRVHRSFIVNKNFARELRPTVDGLPLIVLSNDKQVKIGRQYKSKALNALGIQYSSQ